MQIKGKNIIIIGLQPWYTDIGSNCKNIALQFAKNNRVLYINIPLNRGVLLRKNKYPHLQYHFEVLKDQQPALIKIQENFWNYYPKHIHESINWINNHSLFSYFNKINNKRLAADISEAAKTMGFDDYLLFNDNDIFRGFYLKELLKPSLYIYYCRDYLRGVAYFKKHAEWLEPLHIAKADIAVANSTYLADYLKKYNPASYYIGQGCNIELFNNVKVLPTPKDINNIAYPIIGYVGALTSMRLDIDTLVHIARSRPAWQIVLVGPEDADFQKSELHTLPNVFFTGRKDISELPAYVNAFDVCINPQVINMLTVGNYPLKIDEYLAMGKPVVATATQAMELFAPYCYLAKNKEEYVSSIEKALQEPGTEALKNEKISFARSHTWENSVEKLYEVIFNKVNSKSVKDYELTTN